jgi:carboxypeptidase T
MSVFKSLLSLLMSTIVTIATAQDHYNRLLIHLDATHTMAMLAQLGVEVDHGDMRAGTSFSSDFSTSEQAAITAAGFGVDVLIPDVSQYYAMRNTLVSTSAATRAASCNLRRIDTVPTPVHFKTGTMGGFLTYQEMLAQLDSMHAIYPNLISARQQIDTFTSIEGRPIYWMRISNHPDSTQSLKPQIQYTALHHAREPAGLTNMMYYMWYLLEHYQSSTEVKALLDNTEMYIVPCINPDGYVYNQTTNPNGGGLWRKNRRLNSDSTYGVDLNRNYGYNWGFDNTGSSPLTSSLTYRGTSGFSEPETRAIKWFDEHHHFRIGINYHTFSNDLIYPWGYKLGLYTPDSMLFSEMAQTMTRQNGYVYGTGDQTIGYITNGDSDDWMYGEQVTKPKILAMTPEAGSANQGFWPAASDIIGICQDNFEMMYTAHKLLLRYLEVTDVSSHIVTHSPFSFKYAAHRLGLDSTGVYTISLSTTDPRITVPTTVKTITSLSLLGTVIDSLPITILPSMPTYSTFSFVISISDGFTTRYDTITKVYLRGDTIYYNDCNIATAFTTTATWGVTSSSYVSPIGSLTDSPLGKYPNNTSSSISITQPIDLSYATQAFLTYQVRWDLEKDFDIVQLQASIDNGAHWDTLCGLWTTSLPNQHAVYTGLQKNWVEDMIDINSYIGKKLLLRFGLKTDNAVNMDGFYFDDLTVLGIIDSSKVAGITSLSMPSDWGLYPNPAASHIKVEPASVYGHTLHIYTTCGIEVLSAAITHDPISIANLAAGMYYVSIDTRDGVAPMRKLVIGQ